MRDPRLLLDVALPGLIYDVRRENGVIVVEMALASPGRRAREGLPEMVSTHPVYDGPGHVMRQALIALVTGQLLHEHENPAG